MKAMNRYAIWQGHNVIGYIEMNEKQKDIINGIPNVGIYIGLDKITN